MVCCSDGNSRLRECCIERYVMQQTHMRVNQLDREHLFQGDKVPIGVVQLGDHQPSMVW